MYQQLECTSLSRLEATVMLKQAVEQVVLFVALFLFCNFALDLGTQSLIYMMYQKILQYCCLLGRGRCFVPSH